MSSLQPGKLCPMGGMQVRRGRLHCNVRALVVQGPAVEMERGGGERQLRRRRRESAGGADDMAMAAMSASLLSSSISSLSTIIPLNMKVFVRKQLANNSNIHYLYLTKGC